MWSSVAAGQERLSVQNTKQEILSRRICLKLFLLRFMSNTVRQRSSVSSNELENAPGFGGLNKPSHQREQQEIY